MTRKRLLPGLLIGLLVSTLLLAVRIAEPLALTTLRGAGFDTMQRLWPRAEDSSQPVRVIDIDEASLKQLGQWPWPRNKLALLVDELATLGAAAIVFDIVFPEPDRMSPDAVLNDPAVRQALGQLAAPLPANLPNNDQILAAAFANRPVVTAFATGVGPLEQLPAIKAGFAQTGLPALNAPPRLSHVTANLPILDAAAAGTGNIKLDLADQQGIARQIPLLWSDRSNFYPSLDLEALRVAQGADTYVVNGSADTEDAIDSIRVGNIEIPVQEQGQFTVYYNHVSPELYVSAAKVFDADMREKLRPLIEGHIVLIGTSAVGLLDTRASTLGESIPGVSVHAQALQQIMSSKFLQRPEWAAAAEIYFVALIGLAISIGTTLIRPVPLVASLLAIIAAMAAATAYAFRHYGLLLDITFPTLAVATIFLSTIAFRLLVTDREGRQLRSVFSHYVSPAILTEIENNPAALKLGGETRDLTVMFVDIQNFTPMGEALSPEALVTLINTLLSTCSKAILAEGGTIDKFIGDAVMAFWNAPLEQPDHQYHAAMAALDIQRHIADFNADPANQALLKPLGLWPVAVRIGMASGTAVVGNMGSLERFDYSVLGETVNLAARAEGICKHVGHDIIIAGPLDKKTQGLAIIPAGSVLMRGKSIKTPIFLLLGDEAHQSDTTFLSLVSQHAAITHKLATSNGDRPSPALQRAIEAAAESHPAQAKLFKALAHRLNDFKK